MDIVKEVKDKLGNKITNFFEKNPQRYYIDIEPQNIVETAKILNKELGCRLVICSGIDTPKGIEILYHFSHDTTGKIFNVRVLITNKTNPEIESITPTIIGAEWIEREMWELLGIKFKNHPRLKHLILADDWPEGNYPLRQEKR